MIQPKPTIIFDFGGVLLDWDPRHLYRKYFNGDEQAMERFLSEVDFFNWNLLQDAGRPFADGVAQGCAQHPEYCELLKIYDEHYPESIVGQISGSVEILVHLKQAGYSLFGLSNWSAEKFHLVRDQYEFLDCFKQILLSGEVRLAKPDPRIFHLMLEKVGRPASECLLIDDSLKNIEAAQRLGFQTIHFQSPEQLCQELAKKGIPVRD
jgi:2-haloacid dehalogenase